MAKYNSLGGLFTAIANAIRAKTGGTDPIVAEDFPAAVEGISAGGGDIDALIDRSITDEITSNATRIGTNAFYACRQLTSVKLPSATSIEKGGFAECTLLHTIDCPMVTSFGNDAFINNGITNINAPNLTSIGQSCFAGGLARFTTADFPKVTTISDGAFQSHSRLISANLPLVKKISYGVFGHCNKLKRADFSALETLGSGAFNACYSFTTLILRSETMCALSNTDAFSGCYHFLGTVNKTYNPDGLKDGYIYVPRALIEDYKVATNWVTFADQFRALEDYTVDGTITGELDESKVSL